MTPIAVVSVSRRILFVLGLSLAAGTTVVLASETGFSHGLSAHDQDAAGLKKLEPAQRAELDRLIERELALAREGNVRAFAGSFSRRRSDAERAAAGLGLLTPMEIALIDAHVAQRLARPVFMAWSPRARRTAEAETVSAKPEIHGSVSIFYGTGGGASYRGASMDMTYHDPARNLTVTVGVSRIDGKGPRSPYERPAPIAGAPAQP